MSNNEEDSIFIRKFEESDQCAVAELYRSAFVIYQDYIPEVAHGTAWFIEDKLREGGDMNTIYQSYITNDPRKCCWVAVHRGEGRIVGFVGAVPSTEFDPNEYIELVRMAVDSSHRRFGVAAKLLAAVADWGRSIGCSKVNLSTLDGMKPAVAFYLKNGFALVREVEINMGEYIGRTFETKNRVCVVHLIKDI